jgi:hypothetical protein
MKGGRILTGGGQRLMAVKRCSPREVGAMAVTIHGSPDTSRSGPVSDARRESAAAPPARLHWIDWLRGTAIAGVFVFHTLRPFNTDDGHVKNAEARA